MKQPPVKLKIAELECLIVVGFLLSVGSSYGGAALLHHSRSWWVYPTELWIGAVFALGLYLLRICYGVVVDDQIIR